jgi:hypothetical protein
MTDSHEQHALALFVGDDLPVFRGTSYDDHVEAWQALDLSGQRHQWALASIAASLERHLGGRPIKGMEPGLTDLQRFAHDVRCSTRWLQMLAKTYRTFAPTELRKPASAVLALSFRHHLLAATLTHTPEEAVQALERAHDDELSTRELHEALKPRPAGAGTTIDRSTVPWSAVPPDVTVDGLMRRLWQAVQTGCGCPTGPAGSGGCPVCQVWQRMIDW